MSSVAIAMAAPVLPALKVASASPFLTIMPRNDQGRVPLTPRGLNGVLAHCHGLRCMSDGHGIRDVLLGIQYGLNGGLVADKDDLHLRRVSGHLKRPMNDLCGRVIAAHRVNRDSHGHDLLFGSRFLFDRNRLFAVIETAFGTGMVIQAVLEDGTTAAL